MNQYLFKDLKNILNVINYANVKDFEMFDYLRIVDLNNKKFECCASNILYFLSYPTRDELENGWYISDFDLRPHIKKIISKYPNYTFVIEKGMEVYIDNSNTKYIVVDNIRQSIDNLYRYTLHKSNAKVISVTGSVGKTTTVGLIEKLLSIKYNVLRIYSKRITPINLQANIINFLNQSVDYIVLENSLYYKNNVKDLSNMLNTDIAALLNIKTSHLGIDTLKTIDDICMAKAEIMRYSKKAFINGNDAFLKKIKLSSGYCLYNNKKLFKNNKLKLYHINSNRVRMLSDQFLIDNKYTIQPFVLSDLSRIQYLTAIEVANELNIDTRQCIDALINYQPVEHRLNTENAFDRMILFDGDITTYERMEELSKIKSNPKYLILRKIGSAEDNGRLIGISKFFSEFEKVFIFDDNDYYEYFMNCKNVIAVNDNSFIFSLKGYIIYHYSGYYRVWDNFNEKNLNTYDNTIYKVKR